MNRKVAVFISGQGTNLKAIIDAKDKSFLPIDIVLVVTNDKNAGGVSIARSSGLPVFCLEEDNKGRDEYDRILDKCVEHNVELVVLAGWMRILTNGFINRYISKIINIHPALPGRYPGTLPSDVLIKIFKMAKLQQLESWFIL